jgi:peptide/nickel transport system substrate-binding protein/oligopeptide transport system substrate-binding protein
MDNFLYPLFLSTSGDNYSKYNNPAVDTALSEARKVVDDDQRKIAYRAINQLVGADLPVIPLFYYSHNNVCSDKVVSFYLDAQTKGDFEKAELA